MTKQCLLLELCYMEKHCLTKFNMYYFVIETIVSQKLM